MRRHRDGDALSRAVEKAGRPCDCSEDCPSNTPSLRGDELPGEAIHRAVCENA